MKFKIAIFFIAVFVSFLQSCQPEENETFDSNIQEVQLKTTSVETKSNGIQVTLPPETNCPRDNTTALYVKYKTPLKEVDKQRIRKNFSKHFTIIKVITSNNCNDAEFWIANCQEYQQYRFACQLRCHTEEEVEAGPVEINPETTFPFPDLPDPCDYVHTRG